MDAALAAKKLRSGSAKTMNSTMVKRKNGTNSSFMCSPGGLVDGTERRDERIASGPLVHEMQQRTDRAGEREANQPPNAAAFFA